LIPLPDLLSRVYGRAPRGIELGLDRVGRALDALDHPERNWASLHIAGTNGKGSVAAIASLALQQAGYRVGLFTSPHLHRFAERIRIDQIPLDDDRLAQALALALSFDLTFFETAFIAAIIAFHQAKTECAVFEVGLGGRLDATNVIEKPVATAVTRIALDHGSVLGYSLETIAFEKASIAKPGCPMVIGPMPEPARLRVQQVACERGANPVVFANHTPWAQAPLHPRLAGHHQHDNATVAAALCFHATTALNRLTLTHLQRAVATVTWPGRLESLAFRGIEVLLDGAHNPDAIDALVAHVNRRHLEPNRVALVFGAMQDKAWKTMLTILQPIARHRFFVEPHGRQPAALPELQATLEGKACASASQAIEIASQIVGPTGLIVVCGSLFLVAETRSWLLQEPSDPMVAL
jgi:dihydrofolate synthase/folylpolyglutamate synthase